MTDTRRQLPEPTCPSPGRSVGAGLFGAARRAIRIVVALVVGAVCGACLTAGWIVIESLIWDQTQPDAGLTLATMAFYVALTLWAGGLLVVGLPVLGLFHALGVRSRRVAVMVGALLVGLVQAAWLNLPASSGHEFTVLALFVAGQALAGAIVGGLVAWIAYGRKAAA